MASIAFDRRRSNGRYEPANAFGMTRRAAEWDRAANLTQMSIECWYISTKLVSIRLQVTTSRSEPPCLDRAIDCELFFWVFGTVLSTTI
jgi:hypothetical protein